jgi:hypothetical protein
MPNALAMKNISGVYFGLWFLTLICLILADNYNYFFLNFMANLLLFLGLVSFCCVFIIYNLWQLRRIGVQLKNGLRHIRKLTFLPLIIGFGAMLVGIYLSSISYPLTNQNHSSITLYFHPYSFEGILIFFGGSAINTFELLWLYFA